MPEDVGPSFLQGIPKWHTRLLKRNWTENRVWSCPWAGVHHQSYLFRQRRRWTGVKDKSKLWPVASLYSIRQRNTALTHVWGNKLSFAVFGCGGLLALSQRGIEKARTTCRVVQGYHNGWEKQRGLLGPLNNLCFMAMMALALYNGLLVSASMTHPKITKKDK